MSVARSELEQTVHRLANRLECEVADLFRELLVDSRTEAAAELAWKGINFVTFLRAVRDGKDGDQ